MKRVVLAAVLVGCDALVGVGNLSVPDECASTPLDSGLVAYFPFDEGDGGCARNCASATANACFVGAQRTWTPLGWRNGGVGVDNNGGGCMHVENLAFDSATFTFSGWIDPIQATNNNYGTIIGRHVTLASTGWRLYTSQDDAGAGGVGFHIYAGDAGGWEIFVPAPHPVHQWWHVVLAYVPDAGATLAVDDASTTRTGAPPIDVSAGDLRIGCRSDNTQGYNLIGTIDEVRVYDRALTLEEIAALEPK